MYPVLELIGYKIYFHGIGIVLASLIFIWGIYRYSHKTNLKFSLIFSYLPLFIILPYIFGRYFYNVLTYKLFIPTDLFFLLSPVDYRFSFIGVTFGFFLAFIIFIINFKYPLEKKKWFDVFFYSISLSLIVIGPFLLLGDVFFGNVTNSIFGVSALTNNTNIPYPTNKFWPVGIFVSILGLILYLGGKFLHFLTKKPGITLVLFPFIWLGFWGIFHYQYYQKHFLFGIDVKLLYCILVAVLGSIFFYWLLNYKKG